MPKFNDKTDVTSKGLRDLAARLDHCVRRFSEAADELDSNEIPTIELAVDTFRTVTLARLESFTRTVERELLRRKDIKAQEANANVAKMMLDTAVKKTAEHRKNPKSNQ